ncbi:hypothetical protein RCL1_004845 [Eukaryota sp. TZLM3-RCL]
MVQIEFWLREIESNLKEIDDTLSSASGGKLSNDELTSIVSSTEKQLKQVHLNIRTATTFLVDVEWKREEVQNQLNAFSAKRSELVDFHAEIKRRTSRASLIGDVDNLTDGQKIRGAQIIADKTSTMIKQGRGMLAGIETTGVAAADALAQQTQTMVNIHTNQQELKSELKIADQQLRVFMRSMMTDKIIMSLLFLIIAGVVFIIVYSFLNPDSDFNVPDDFKPKSFDYK